MLAQTYHSKKRPDENRKEMIKSESEYRSALEELQQFLEAAKPPPIGSPAFNRFEKLLENIEAYEASLNKSS